MIEFRDEWTKGMDGHNFVVSAVKKIEVNGPPSDAVDITIAYACHHGDEIEEVTRHLDYIINQLIIVRQNMLADAEVEQVMLDAIRKKKRLEQMPLTGL